LPLVHHIQWQLVNGLVSLCERTIQARGGRVHIPQAESVDPCHLALNARLVAAYRWLASLIVWVFPGALVDTVLVPTRGLVTVQMELVNALFRRHCRLQAVISEHVAWPRRNRPVPKAPVRREHSRITLLFVILEHVTFPTFVQLCHLLCHALIRLLCATTDIFAFQLYVANSGLRFEIGCKQVCVLFASGKSGKSNSGVVLATRHLKSIVDHRPLAVVFLRGPTDRFELTFAVFGCSSLRLALFFVRPFVHGCCNSCHGCHRNQGAFESLGLLAATPLDALDLVVRIGGNVLAREQRPVQDLPKATVALVGVHSHWKGDSHCANKTHLAQEAGERAKHKSTTADTVEAFGE
jgi:hypothetical protein